jgi:hypothetical protein
MESSWNCTHNNSGISNMPQINGTLNIKDGINSFLTKNISVPFFCEFIKIIYWN